MSRQGVCERTFVSSLALGTLGLALISPSVAAEDATFRANVVVAQAQQPAADLDTMREEIRNQFRKLEEQTRLLEKQRRELQEQHQQLELLERRLARPGESQPAAIAPPKSSPATAPPQPSTPAPEKGSEPPPSVAARPQQEAPAAPPPVNLLADVGGVLTRRGVLVVEPQFEYSYDTSSRFFFDGVEIVDAVLIGLIEVNNAQREIFTESLKFRYGITSRLEVDASIPWVYRHDRSSRQEVGDSLSETTTDNANLGDIEFGLHYQINRGLEGWPFFVGNLRVKTDSGEGPFDIKRNREGIEKETATGSGFWAIEPSLTMIYPSDPAVLFGNIGYLYGFEKDVSKNIGVTSTNPPSPIRVDEVSPGGSIRASFGVGFALNERFSLSLGYEHNWIAGTDQTIRFSDTEGREISQKNESDDFQVGSLLFGLSYTITDRIGFNINVAAGVTEDAPDVRITVRLPISFDLFK